MPTISPLNRSNNPESQTQPDQPLELGGHTSAEVLKTKRLLLRKGLPLEVVDTVLDFAEYWSVASTISHYEAVKTVRSPYSTGNVGTLLYLRTLPLPGVFKPEQRAGDRAGEGCGTGYFIGDYPARGQYPVRKIVFKIVSKDQGWSSNEGRGTYNGAWSWFEVNVQRPSSIGAITIADLEPLANAIEITKTKTDDDINSPWKPVVVTKKSDIKDNRSLKSKSVERNTWHLQSNVHAGDDWKTHLVTWKHDGPDSGNIDGSTGAGTGADLVRCLKPGDRINLVAKARFPGWANSVRSAEVHVFYAV
ncbi:hypothetical protein L873DRAFT_1700735 [Choiromyces venosus 120613-1]|uniref:Uncharacterized protein n=1 Tax=Choiromyces venosus 120613-1 TaxID=1336337 RepID=A0A3N4JL88_9PEZI|nr:hypothetical protein L873DRAFT_1700735 [Choiromyces venosus 120613-1]